MRCIHDSMTVAGYSVTVGNMEYSLPPSDHVSVEKAWIHDTYSACNASRAPAWKSRIAGKVVQSPQKDFKELRSIPPTD
jgi:hypothetical protein